jgi:hypothetical protein
MRTLRVRCHSSSSFTGVAIDLGCLVVRFQISRDPCGSSCHERPYQSAMAGAGCQSEPPKGKPKCYRGLSPKRQRVWRGSFSRCAKCVRPRGRPSSQASRKVECSRSHLRCIIPMSSALLFLSQGGCRLRYGQTEPRLRTRLRFGRCMRAMMNALRMAPHSNPTNIFASRAGISSSRHSMVWGTPCRRKWMRCSRVGSIAHSIRPRVASAV